MNREAAPLELELVGMIEAAGPMPLDRYMALCLGHPLYGYYMTRDPLGSAGDFTTAPEVTQMFGEIIGIWCMQCFEVMGKPQGFDLIELGPGRGTLMSDLLRAARAMPEFLERVRIRLVEMSPVLRAAQEKALTGTPAAVTWHDSLDGIPSAATLLIANEFFDALPVRQFQRLQQGWAERAIGLKEGKLAMGLIPTALKLPDWTAQAKEGDIAEMRPAAAHWGASIGERLAHNLGAALIIDYGHLRSSLGDTLQGVRHHQMVSVLERPGDTDLTSHVDFEALGQAIRSGGASLWPAMTQASFLHDMGLELRAGILARNASEAEKRDLSAAMERVAGPKQMGHLFKVMAATSRGLPRPHPFSG
ncbi:MAG TPA: SAM-dependent methyltransferase [Aestuariivirgaceae bacterium]|nr:SAM-dependent methyltransferase [Aestuariivirgaceae bacterium]